MKRTEHYLTLRSSRPQAAIGEAVPVTLDELAGILDCTKQNVRLVLRQLEADGWIRWQAGRGRGNRSALTFCRDAEQVAYERALELAAQGELSEAFAQMRAMDAEVKGRFLEALSAKFGYQEEASDEETLDLLREVMLAPYRSLDPAFSYFAREFNMATQIYDCLVKVNAQTREIEPHVALSWEMEEDGRVWTFYLRKGVLFHHGRELTAQDVAATWQRLRDVSPFRWAVEGVEEIRVLKKTVVQVRLREPNFLFLHWVAATPFSIVREDAEALVGTGPFRVACNDSKRLVLEAHRGYFQGRPFLDRVEFWVVPSDQLSSAEWSQMAALHVGGRLQEKPEDWQEKRLSKRFVQYLTFNLAKDGPQRMCGFAAPLPRRLTVRGLSLRLAACARSGRTVF